MRIAIMGLPGGKSTQAQRVAARAPKALRVKVEALGRDLSLAARACSLPSVGVESLKTHTSPQKEEERRWWTEEGHET